MKTIKCPGCGKDAQATGSVSCLCDRDYCSGQRCHADNLRSRYECDNCGANGTPPNTMSYMERHCT
ncbi:MAG: hypothetical protein RPS47_09375 [Colwellia sp.]|jgi:hypothetical protein